MCRLCCHDMQAAADVLAMASLEVDLSGIQEGEVRRQTSGSSSRSITQPGSRVHPAQWRVSGGRQGMSVCCSPFCLHFRPFACRPTSPPHVCMYVPDLCPVPPVLSDRDGQVAWQACVHPPPHP